MTKLAFFIVAFAALALVLSLGGGCRCYTVNVYGDAPLSIRVDADVEHRNSLPVSLK